MPYPPFTHSIGKVPAWWQISIGGKESLGVKDGSSLTCLAADESEPYCLNDGEKVWLGEVKGAGVCMWMRGGEEYFQRRLCSLVAHSQ